MLAVAICVANSEHRRMTKDGGPSLITDIRLFAGGRSASSSYLEKQEEAIAYGRRIAWLLNSEGFSLGAFPALYASCVNADRREAQKLSLTMILPKTSSGRILQRGYPPFNAVQSSGCRASAPTPLVATSFSSSRNHRKLGSCARA